MFAANRLLMRRLFRLQVTGAQHLAARSPFILAPNHTSTLDPAALAAAIPYEVLRRTHWAGRKGAVLTTPLRRRLNRLAQTVPVDRDLSALAGAATVLRRGQNLVWFPEGTRTLTGELQEFRPGVGLLLYHLRIPVVPAYIEGAYEAWPPQRRLPRRFSPISVRFGPPIDTSEVIGEGGAEQEEAVARLVAAVRNSVLRLADDNAD